MITPILIDIDNFFNNDVIMSSSLKKLSISIKIHVGLVKQLCPLCSVSKLSTESVGSRRELVANRVHTADADADADAAQLAGGVYSAYDKPHVHCSAIQHVANLLCVQGVN